MDGIWKNFLSNNLPDNMFLSLNASYDNYESVKVFDLFDGNGSILEQYTVLYDWSYKFEFRGASNQNGLSLSHPVDRIQYNSNDGITTTLMNQGGKWFTRTQRTNYPTNGCGKVGLYYLNRYGGWDYYLFKGNVTKRDSYYRYDISNEFNNKKLDFEKSIYNNQISTEYNVNSGYLNDTQSDTFAFNLISTNRCYLVDYDDNAKVHPAIINDVTTDYKTRKNAQGMVNYNINIELSQQKEIL